jgi:hypothetical protein
MIDEKVQEQNGHVKAQSRNVFLALIVGFIVVFAGALLSVRMMSWGGPTCGDTDTLTVVVDSPSARFQLFLPIPVEKNGSHWYLLDLLEIIQGSVNYSVIDTPNGLMLSVESNESVTFSAQAMRRAEPYYAVIPQNNSWPRREGDLPFLVFLNASGRESEISFSLRADSCDYPYKFATRIDARIGDLRQGWQEIYGGAYEVVP